MAHDKTNINIKTISELVIPAICFVGYTWPGTLLAHIPSWSYWSEPANTPDSLSCHGHTAGSLSGLLSR